ncbi:MAG TPA: Crp/Fnr family transcriptional regulator [Chitinophagales bacterium]|nr:Crp/Fnr family transcriptional regulator [Chitinophagales bacterium]HMU69601.1 Crp/Fnr family transcriptional regulator [Chitinophagales bacterium]HMX05017.1 Crp/Fnr family transcriptional regulator [Chitinophagales bacterium]HMZ89100.1 Crp/Fnr family transcriptional regulator [Chitinophagales bacterium]HNA58007.1 Crp/Fnr family transcriptional regulator [Chitinophagales bacterium]
MDDIRALLDNHFPQFEDALVDRIASVATLRTFARDEVMMYSGRYFKSTILIVGGRVKLYRESNDGKEYFMYYIEPGNACALSMICAARNQASEITAVAVEDTQVIQVPLEIMDDLMREYKSWYYFVLETYRSRFEELLVVIDQIAFKHMDERLEHYLFNQFNEYNSRRLEITHQQIANDLSSTREVISRLLKKMEQNGKIKLHRNEIELINLFV